MWGFFLFFFPPPFFLHQDVWNYSEQYWVFVLSRFYSVSNELEHSFEFSLSCRLDIVLEACDFSDTLKVSISTNSLHPRLPLDCPLLHCFLSPVLCSSHSRTLVHNMLSIWREGVFSLESGSSQGSFLMLSLACTQRHWTIWISIKLFCLLKALPIPIKMTWILPQTGGKCSISINLDTCCTFPFDTGY